MFAVTEIRGVGKTQVAAYARRRVGEGWWLVARVAACDEALVLAVVAVSAGLGAAGEERADAGGGGAVLMAGDLPDSAHLDTLTSMPVGFYGRYLTTAGIPDDRPNRVLGASWPGSR